MELTIQLEDNADISFIKKLLSQIKGIKSVDVSEEDKTYSWDEIENSEYFGKVMEQSREQINNGEYIEHSEELMNSIFRKK
ncbi:hypothetical protein SAMN05421789_11534 [Kaistella chaponensis]|jgi:queuine/archaeosine tRNA-ribosyltransferase|uniref:Uncharacterized protein n=1 Tax=Kaistella chaponensis TaxID=713588 RepID=A0A1N7NK29_9FLAO|nr:hypothetical protein [Kaistella chaponensis]SIS98620.1 hypothetical protein SAMN05421789_11534 [Kaistella chaponensis]